MILLTGDKHSGKTRFILELAQQTRLHGRRVAGIASPGFWKNGMRNGFELLDLDTGRRQLLSMRVPGLQPVPFMFDALGLESGKKALSAARCSRADLVIVDEVGPLELRGAGWAPCLKELLPLSAPLQIWVVRRSIAEKIQAHFRIKAAWADINQDNCMSGLLERLLQGP